jgi:transcriptional regulator with XRE-family HTH domain
VSARHGQPTETGERCGFYQTYLSRLERGQANPTLNAMEVIANGLGLTIYELWEQIRVLPRGPT